MFSLAFSLTLALAACNDAAAPPAASPPPPPPGATSPSATSTTAGDPGAATPAVASVPPDFSATASDGTPVHLAALKGKPVVVYFYPKDETPGCTAEACSFRDAWTSLSAKGVVLIGISADSDESHRGFAANHKLPFLLVSDTSGAIAAKFGVPVRGGYTARQSFVIGADGKVKKVYRTVDVGTHAAEIAADVQ
jgi:peroxiredoxin Q/BCP